MGRALSNAAPRLARFVPLLGSDKPGEVVAAAAAIGRTLKGAGADWHDLADMIQHAPKEHPNGAFCSAPQWETMPVIERMRWLSILSDPDYLATQWEQALATNIADRMRAFPHTQVSPRQAQALNAAISAAISRGVRL